MKPDADNPDDLFRQALGLSAPVKLVPKKQKEANPDDLFRMALGIQEEAEPEVAPPPKMEPT